MKALLTIALSLIVTIVTAQLEVKELVLGNKYNEDPFTATTLGGIDGVLGGKILNDGTLYIVIFMCGSELFDDKVRPNRIYSSDVDMLVTGLETKYDIKFKKIKAGSYSNDYLYNVSKGGYTYSIMTEHNQFMDPPTRCTIFIKDDYLTELHEQEQQKKANQDFL